MSLITSTTPQGSGLVHLSDCLRTWLSEAWIARKHAENGAPAPIVGSTGWKQREQNEQAPQGANRILILPGHGSGNARQLGTLEMPRHSGIGTPGFNKTNDEGTARTNATWARKFTVSVWSYDPENDRDEERQIAASDTLLELTLDGLLTVSAGSIQPIGNIYQDTFSTNAPFGVELLVELIHREPLFGLPNDVITDVSAIVTSGQT